jgi:hypothetical protein
MYKTLAKINGYVDNKKTGRTDGQLGRKTGEQKARQATKQAMRLSDRQETKKQTDSQMGSLNKDDRGIERRKACRQTNGGHATY